MLERRYRFTGTGALDFNRLDAFSSNSSIKGIQKKEIARYRWKK